jgi:hypothetical protein
MSNIIKETLTATKNELAKQITQANEQLETQLNTKATNIVSSIDELFKEFTITISERTIEFRFTVDSWYDFRIERTFNYKIDKPEYGKATLSTSSVTNADENGLKKLICLGILSKHCLNNTNEWVELTSLMNESDKMHKANISSLYTQMYQIDSELRKIENEEKANAFENIFKLGTFKLNKEVNYYYGSGKWDRIYSNEFFWEANESGKTYTLSYIDTRRTNPHYDSEGNSIEGIFEKTKRSINKRIKKADIESFVKYNAHNILVEVAI